MHENDTGHGEEEECSFLCADCDREFYSQRALGDHQRAKGHGEYYNDYDDEFECEYCGDEFSSEHGLQQHQRDVHERGAHRAPSSSSFKSGPPFAGAVGYWVAAPQFAGKKSFSIYKCDCGHQWMSAHGYKKYHQGCQACDAEHKPKYMWQNTGDSDSTRLDRETDAPHDTSRCEVCRDLGYNCVTDEAF